MKPWILIWIFSLFLLGSCTAPPPTEEPKPSLTPTLTPSPSVIPGGRVFVTRAATPTAGPLAPLAVITPENAFDIRALRTLKLPGFTRVPAVQCNPAFSPDGNILLGACGSAGVPAWDVQSGELLFNLETAPIQVTVCEFDPAGTIIACGGTDGRITLWDAGTGKKLDKAAEIGSAVYDLEFSPDGANLASCAVDDNVRLWDAAGMSQIWKSDVGIGCTTISFSLDGGTIAYATMQGKAGLINTSDGKGSQVLLELQKPVLDINFDPTGEFLAAGAGDDLVYLWNTRDYEKVRVLHGHYHAVNGVVFDPSSSLLVSCSSDGGCHVWDVQSGQTLKITGGHEDIVFRAAVSPDRRIIATISLDGTIRFWGVAED